MRLSIPGDAFISKYFTPENWLAEVICALIMVLSFTATTGATFEDTSPNALLIAVLGCNIAWGIVDGTTYVLGNLMTRGSRARLVAALKASPDDAKANALVTDRIDAVLGDVLTGEQREQVRRWIVDGAVRVEPEPVKVKKEDFYTGLACFLIVFGSALPILVPFLLIERDSVALRASNAVMLAMLFAVGWRWAGFANTNRWKTGLALLGVGLVLVVITIALGG
jgi:hypothetical protein